MVLEYYYTEKVQLNVNDSNSHLIGMIFALFSGIQKIKTSGAEFRVYHQWAKAYAPTEPFSSRQPLASFYMTSVSHCLKFLPMIVTMWAAWYYGLSLSDYIAYCAVLGLVCNSILQLQMPLLFDGLNLTINSGDYVALVGTSGCGKSTLMRLMLGLEHPLGGSIFYDQYDLSDINLRSLRRYCMGICMQDGQLIEGTIRDNIIFNDPLLTDEDAWEAARLAALDGDIRKFPLGKKAQGALPRRGHIGTRQHQPAHCRRESGQTDMYAYRHSPPTEHHPAMQPHHCAEGRSCSR